MDGLALNWYDWGLLPSVHVYTALCSALHGRAHSPFSHATVCTQRNVCVTPSPPPPFPLSPLFPSLIWIWSSLNHRQHCCATVSGSQARRAERYSCEQVFLTLPSNYYQDTAECNPGGNERSCWCGKSSCSHRLASVGAVSRGRRSGGTFTFFIRGCECLVLMFVHTWRPYMNPSKVFLKISKCSPNSVNSLYQEMQFFWFFFALRSRICGHVTDSVCAMLY